MAGFAQAPEDRDQIVLFPTKLDEVIPSDHRVRLLDDILHRLDWSKWEETYDLRKGQPPIHPRILVGAILYGVLNRILSSRQLEEALLVRNDFRWLVMGHTLDHTTICLFRQSKSELIKGVFVQIGMIARELGHLPLRALGFDGTKVRANNRRSGTRTPAELRAAQRELAEQYQELEAKANALDAADLEKFDDESRTRLGEELAETDLRRQRVDAALAELAKADKEPPRIPITDPQSRVTPNKEGGFAPNYTPLATVDIDSGMIVSADVIPGSDEDKHLLAAVDDVKESFGLEEEPEQLLADGLNGTGENLQACEERGIDLYSPIKLGVEGNPAERDDPRQPVSPDDYDRLPTTTTKRKDGSQKTQLNKNAFIYDEENNCYWCPTGKQLNYQNQTSQEENGRRRVRFRYLSDKEDCVDCPLRDLCLSGKKEARQISHEQHEEQRRAQAEKMKQPEAQATYARRRAPGERPFGVIKAQYGVRQFRTRSLVRVRKEWLWLVSAFNIDVLLSLLRTTSGLDPPGGATSPS